MKQGLRTICAKSLISGAEARGFEPRMAAKPNHISSPFVTTKTVAAGLLLAQSAQVSGVAA